MAGIVWSASAREDLAEIIGFIAERDPYAAIRMRRVFESAVQPLHEHPYLFKRSERVPGVREVVAHPNYVILYQVLPDEVKILSIVHARQMFPQPGE